MDRRVLVVGLGGNALAGLRDSERGKRDHLADAAGSLAALSVDHQLVVTHGNGPQVGRLAEEHPGAGLDELDAATAGELGYQLARRLRSRLPAGSEVLATLTQVLVDPADAAFTRPTKPIGPRYDEATARRLAALGGWEIAAEPGGWRRVVASPEPLRILELRALRLLVDAGVTVICAGGGGIPVVEDADGTLRGVDAVIDKDLTTAQLAVDLDAAGLLLLTDVTSVQRGFGTPAARVIDVLTVADAAALELPAGSMGAKVAGAARYAAATGRTAWIGSLADAAAIVAGETGTAITPS